VSEPRETIDVVLVEDNDVFRNALGLLLGLTPDLRVVAAVADGETALEVCPPLAPDVFVMDYRLPGRLDGVQATAAIREACPSAAVVVLTAAAEADEVRALHDAGAVACLTKDGDLDAIVTAIRDAGRPRVAR